jgi:class 3 adenylate cyclase
MRCPACSHENPNDADFCEECAGDLVRPCVSCGTTNTPTAKFCKRCRAALTAGGASSTAPSSEAPVLARTAPLPTAFASGRYTVRAFLGEGAKKRVYLAHDTKLDRDVAFALIKTDGLDADGIVRVRREAQAMGRLGDNAHIVTIHDTGDENGAPFIVSQLMAGGSVEDLLAKSEQHRIPPERAMKIAEQVCAALAHAHGRGIIHRDLKPGNVWLDNDGNAALGDFGLAIAIDRSRMTMQGMMVGTVAYMPPEQALGRTPDARSDLYALGAMLYETVTGRPPFLGDDAVGVISQHINTAPVDPSWHNPECPKPLEALILRLLAKSPDERPATAQDVAQEIRRILDRSTIDSVHPREPDAVTDLRALNWGFFVGRREEMDGLKEALDNALSGKGSLAMLVGEPGIGKTRLAEEFGVYAGLRGAQVLTGHCYEGESSLPYRPFVEAFRQYTRSRPDDELRTQLGPGAPEIATLVSEIRQRFPDIEEAPKLDPEAERLRLFESVTEFLHNASTAQPLVLHLDDLHWADKPSLLLLQHLAQRTARDRLLILGAYRDIELDRTHPLSEVLGALRRLPNYRRVLLRGLPQDSVTDLLAIIDPSEEGQEGREALAGALYQETEGNPFFIREVLAHLIETGKIVHEAGRWVGKVTSVSELGIPEGVREVIGRRLSRLSDGCNRMLTLASTMTGGFSWEALKAIDTDVPETELLDLLEEALAAQLIAERKGETSTYDFTHALIRQTLYGELSGPRRVLLHRQIGEALERLYATNIDAHLPELAHHFYQAAPGGDIEKAATYANSAGDRAMGVTAWEEAAGQYERALQALELQTPADGARMSDVLIALGEAQWGAGAADNSAAAFRRAADLARGIDDDERLAIAALGYAKLLSVGIVREDFVHTLREAIERMPTGDSALKARLLARLGQELYFGSQDEFRKLTTDALDMARRVGDRAALSETLTTRMWGGTTFIDSAEDRLAAANEILFLAEETGDRQRFAWGLFQRVSNRMVVGEIDAADADIELYAHVADELRMPFYFWQLELLRGMRALFAGRIEEGERLAQTAFAIGQPGQPDTALQMFSAQLFAIRREQGRLEELAEGIRAYVESLPAVPAWRTALAFNYAERGLDADTRTEFEILAKDDFVAFPRDANWPIAMALLTETCAYLRDTERASLLYDELAPSANRCIIVGACVDGYGASHRLLGRLAGVLGRWDDAERHFEDALEMNARMGSHRWLGWTQFQYAELLGQRSAPGDREKALRLLSEAIDIGGPLGLKALVDRSLKLKMELQGIAPGSIYTSIDNVARAIELERPAITIHPAPDGTVTIMFSDIEDSTVLTERLGDQAWQQLLNKHNALIREQLQAHDGFEVKTMGDGFMVAFQSAKKGLDCAIAIQRAFDGHNAVEGELVKVRIGLHAGEAIKDGDDFYGKNVIMASRVAGKAVGGEILVSSLLRQLVESSVGAGTFGEPREVELKGLSGTHTVFAVAAT